MAQPRPLERAKLLFFRYFEQTFVLLLVLAMVAIHNLVDQKFAFLSFYYLPMILAGFYGGRRFAVMAGVFVVGLVFYWQDVQGLDMLPGLYGDALLALAPWAGFLILTGYVVGGLAEQRQARLAEVKNAYLATLELLTYHIESAERNQQGHSNRVAEIAAGIGRELALPEEDVEDLRVAAYTVVHVAAFAVAGIVFVAIAEQVERTPALILIAAMAAIVLEAVVVAVMALGAQWVLGALGVWTVVAANVLAVCAMGWYVWATHPVLRRRLREPVQVHV